MNSLNPLKTNTKKSNLGLKIGKGINGIRKIRITESSLTQNPSLIVENKIEHYNTANPIHSKNSVLSNTAHKTHQFPQSPQDSQHFQDLQLNSNQHDDNLNSNYDPNEQELHSGRFINGVYVPPRENLSLSVESNNKYRNKINIHYVANKHKKLLNNSNQEKNSQFGQIGQFNAGESTNENRICEGNEKNKRINKQKLQKTNNSNEQPSLPSEPRKHKKGGIRRNINVVSKTDKSALNEIGLNSEGEEIISKLENLLSSRRGKSNNSSICENNNHEILDFEKNQTVKGRNIGFGQEGNLFSGKDSRKSNKPNPLLSTISKSDNQINSPSNANPHGGVHDHYPEFQNPGKVKRKDQNDKTHQSKGKYGILEQIHRKNKKKTKEFDCGDETHTLNLTQRRVKEQELKMLDLNQRKEKVRIKTTDPIKITVDDFIDYDTFNSKTLDGQSPHNQNDLYSGSEFELEIEKINHMITPHNFNNKKYDFILQDHNFAIDNNNVSKSIDNFLLHSNESSKKPVTHLQISNPVKQDENFGHYDFTFDKNYSKGQNQNDLELDLNASLKRNTNGKVPKTSTGNYSFENKKGSMSKSNFKFKFTKFVVLDLNCKGFAVKRRNLKSASNARREKKNKFGLLSREPIIDGIREHINTTASGFFPQTQSSTISQKCSKLNKSFHNTNNIVLQIEPTLSPTSGKKGLSPLSIPSNSIATLNTITSSNPANPPSISNILSNPLSQPKITKNTLKQTNRPISNTNLNTHLNTHLNTNSKINSKANTNTNTKTQITHSNIAFGVRPLSVSHKHEPLKKNNDLNSTLPIFDFTPPPESLPFQINNTNINSIVNTMSSPQGKNSDIPISQIGIAQFNVCKNTNFIPKISASLNKSIGKAKNAAHFIPGVGIGGVVAKNGKNAKSCGNSVNCSNSVLINKGNKFERSTTSNDGAVSKYENTVALSGNVYENKTTHVRRKLSLKSQPHLQNVNMNLSSPQHQRIKIGKGRTNMIQSEYSQGKGGVSNHSEYFSNNGQKVSEINSNTCKPFVDSKHYHTSLSPTGFHAKKLSQGIIGVLDVESKSHNRDMEYGNDEKKDDSQFEVGLRKNEESNSRKGGCNLGRNFVTKQTFNVKKKEIENMKYIGYKKELNLKENESVKGERKGTKKIGISGGISPESVALTKEGNGIKVYTHNLTPAPPQRTNPNFNLTNHNNNNNPPTVFIPTHK